MYRVGSIISIGFCSILLLFGSKVVAEPLKRLEQLPSAALIYTSADGKIHFQKNPHRQLIPASTVKLLTALMAIDAWGLAHRFTTEFYLQPKTGYLWVKGLADPMLVSEEIDLIAESLGALGIDQFKGIGVDESYFANRIILPGRGSSDNPYDAPVSALAANFNSIAVVVGKDIVRSQEEQTPLTDLAMQLSLTLPAGKQRINLGKQEYGGRYFAEILTMKLEQKGIAVENVITKGTVPDTAQLLLTHQNRHELKRVIVAMLKYSNNFIASQLYLGLGVEKYGTPADPVKARRAVDEYIAENFRWKKYQLFDGAGLSRDNSLSPSQLIDVLAAFQGYIDLMPAQNTVIRAKTGTLNGVSTYAGYIKRDQQWNLFAFMINQAIDYRFREKLAEQLSQY